MPNKASGDIFDPWVPMLGDGLGNLRVREPKIIMKYIIVQFKVWKGLTFDAEKDFRWPLVVMDAEVEGTLAGNPDLLRDVITTVGEGATC